MAHRLLLDTSSLMYRSFFALPAAIRDSAGRSVNAVFGYLDMTARLVGSRRPDAAVHVYDDTIAPAARLRAFPAYKAHRRPDPEDLPHQFELLDEVLDAFGAERASAAGWEADDAIATICGHAGGDNRIEIVTGDRDLLQLVRDEGPTIRVLFTVKGVSDLALFDEAAVLAKYGVPAARYADLATLRGDPSDGLPGVPGVGAKTGVQLVGTYASIDALLDAVDALPRSLGARVRDCAGYLRAMREVVPLRTDVQVTLRRGIADPGRLAALAQTRNLTGPIRRLASALDLVLPED